jgi:hypothetical protein
MHIFTNAVPELYGQRFLYTYLGRLMQHTYRVFRKELYNGIPNVRINVLLDCVHRPRFQKTWISLRFGDWLCLRPQEYKIRGGEG